MLSTARNAEHLMMGVSHIAKAAVQMSFGFSASSRIQRPLGVMILGILQIIGTAIILLGRLTSFVLG
ncbi:MAG: hypothetical protein QG670_83 [Thermoproteota archaeon]|nr:hypothetical protein [Thermoproteota archaeon]